MNIFNILREKLEELPIETKTKSNICSCGWIKDINIPLVEKDAVKEIINQVEQQCNDGWIPCSSRILPEEHESIFAKWKGTDKWETGMFERTSDEVNVTVVDKDGNRITHRAHTVDGEWSCDLLKVCKSYHVLAWKPFPAPYKEDMAPLKQTNADRIRAMSDKELAEFIPCPYDTAGDYIMPCLLGEREGNSTKEECQECMMKWLEREVG